MSRSPEDGGGRARRRAIRASIGVMDNRRAIWLGEFECRGRTRNISGSPSCHQRLGQCDTAFHAGVVFEKGVMAERSEEGENEVAA
jgi:hypothetical protein